MIKVSQSTKRGFSKKSHLGIWKISFYFGIIWIPQTPWRVNLKWPVFSTIYKSMYRQFAYPPPPLVSTMVKLQCILLCTVSVAAQPEPLLSSTLTLSTRAILIGISQENWEPPTHTLLIRVHTLIRFMRSKLKGQRCVSYVLISF